MNPLRFSALFAAASAVFCGLALGSAGVAEARKNVRIDLGYSPGTIVVINNERKLYLVTGRGKAIQYPIAVGKASQVWTGRISISQKKVNPEWLNPDDPEAEPMPGGPGNPLGERALYLGSTLYRIHGTPKASSIGSAVSNGCIRMFNADVKHLYKMVRVGTPVVAVNSRAKVSLIAHAPKPVNMKLYLAEKRKVKARFDAANSDDDFDEPQLKPKKKYKKRRYTKKVRVRVLDLG